MKKIFISLLSGILLCACSGHQDLTEISNGSLKLVFDGTDGRLVAMTDLSSGTQMIDSDAVKCLPWAFLKEDRPLEQKTVLKRIYRCGHRTMRAVWQTSEGTVVRAKVTLDRKEPFAYWSASLEGIGEDGAEKFVFPCIGGLMAHDNEQIAFGEWTGYLWHDLRSCLTPEHPVHRCPAKMGMMHLVAIYGDGTPGLYASSDDTRSFNKRVLVLVDSLHTAYTLENYLPMGEKSYRLPYRSVTGPFCGDWMDAAKIYRKWGTAQTWARNSRMRLQKTAPWARDTDIWVWNRGTSENVLDEAADLQDYLDGARVSVLWHWWHNCLYDDTFPEYLPPREGADKFRDAVAKAKDRNINALVYMNAYQWGNRTESWTSEGAERFKALSSDGKDYSKTYNVFTEHSLTPMCLATSFWREKYASMAAEAVCGYGLSGIYMDQLSNTFACYNKDHGHTAGGGDYWTEGGRELTARIRELTADKDVVLACEGHNEQYFENVDLCLTLHGSWERYKYTPNMTIIPLFEAVYHDYATTFGSYTSLTYPPYDEKWPSELRPANCETLLPAQYNTQFRVELARCFVWGIQPMIANYHSYLREERPDEMEFLRRLVKTRAAAPDYLYSGEMVRAPKIDSPTLEMDLSKISLYAGRHGDMLTHRTVQTPALQYGGWKSASGGFAVAVSNVSGEFQHVSFDFDPEQYGVCGDYRVNVICHNGKKTLLDSCNGPRHIELEIGGLDSILIEFTK